MTMIQSRMRGTVSEPQGSLNALEDSGKTAMRGGLITGRGCLTLSSDAVFPHWPQSTHPGNRQLMRANDQKLSAKVFSMWNRERQQQTERCSCGWRIQAAVARPNAVS